MFRMMLLLIFVVAASGSVGVADERDANNGDKQPPLRKQDPSIYRVSKFALFVSNLDFREEMKFTKLQLRDFGTVRFDINRKRKNELRKLRDIKPEARLKFYYDLLDRLHKETDEKLKAILTPAQYQRLDEIMLQVAGERKLFDPEMIKQLKISIDQQRKFIKVQDGVSAEFEKLRKLLVKREIQPAEYRKRWMQADAESKKKLVAVLTEQQRKQYDTMKGKPFPVERTPGFAISTQVNFGNMDRQTRQRLLEAVKLRNKSR